MNKKEIIAHVTSQTKKWSITIGRHHNIIVRCTRYPLDLCIDLGDFTVIDFHEIAKLFRSQIDHSKSSRKIICGGKSTLSFDRHGSLTIDFDIHPFRGSISLGEISMSECVQLSELFLSIVH